MKNVLVLGAGGKIAHWVIQTLANTPEVKLTLFLREGKKLADIPKTAKVVRGDALDKEQLTHAIAGQDIVYVNLSGKDIDQQVKGVVEAMIKANVQRMIFVGSLGIYDEVPGKFGEWNRQTIPEYLPPFRRAADSIEASGLDYTILRAAWLTNNDEVDYETTERNEFFRGTEVSRKSVADLIVKAIESPKDWAGRNLGVNKPNMDGDKPAFR